MIYLSNIDKDGKVNYRHLRPFDAKYGLGKTEEELLKTGVLIENLPERLPEDGRLQILYYDSTQNTCFYKYQELYLNLDEAKQAKIQGLEDNCTKIKDGGFASSCLGDEKIFDSSPENRNLIIGLAMKASLIASGATLADSNIDWKAKDEAICYPWTPQQIITLGVDMSTFLTNAIKHKEQLQTYVNTLTTVEEVQSVTWDTVIPT